MGKIEDRETHPDADRTIEPKVSPTMKRKNENLWLFSDARSRNLGLVRTERVACQRIAGMCKRAGA